MIVADANLIVYQSIQTPFTSQAKKWATADPDWCVPDLWQFEFTNAIVTYRRSGKLEEQEAVDVIASAIHAFSVNQFQVDQTDVFHAAMRYRISSYDANYIVLAEMLGTFCVTADQQMLERVPKWTKAMDISP